MSARDEDDADDAEWIDDDATGGQRNGGAMSESNLGGALPAIGAAGGALLIVFGAPRIGVSEEHAAWGVGAVGAAIAMGSTGAVREIATGVACAGACIGIVRLMERLRAAEKSSTAERRQSDGDRISRAQLDEALAEHARKESEAREQTRATLIATMRDELRSAIKNREPVEATHADPIAAPTPAVAAERTAQPSREERAPEISAPPIVSVAAVAHLQEIRARLTPEEIAFFERLVVTLPPDALATAEAHLIDLSPDDAVAYLRATVLRPLERAA
jgi:hypothetical protein